MCVFIDVCRCGRDLLVEHYPASTLVVWCCFVPLDVLTCKVNWRCETNEGKMRKEQCTFVIPELPSWQTRPVPHIVSVSRTQSLVLSSPWLARSTVFFLSFLLPFQSGYTSVCLCSSHFPEDRVVLKSCQG